MEEISPTTLGFVAFLVKEVQNEARRPDEDLTEAR